MLADEPCAIPPSGNAQIQQQVVEWTPGAEQRC